MFRAHVLVGACLPLVAASVYPTQPVQATVWTADHPMLVSWVDDGKHPTLGETGPFDVSLWWNANTFLAGLASSVDPMTKTCQVMVPAAVLRPGAAYTLRFTTTRPIHTVIYSADFMIVPANTTVAGMDTVGSTASGGGTALATQSGTGTGSGFRTVPTATTTLSVSGTSTASDATLTPLPSGQGQEQRATSAGRRSVDVEKLKFRFVFVIWPVLMGVTMAL